MESLRALWGRFRAYHTSFLLVVVFIGGFALGNQHLVGVAQSDMVAPPGVEKDFEPFWQVYNLIQSSYLEDVESNDLVDGAINGMVDSLGDQFSGYMDPSVYDLINEDLSGEINGIGVVIESGIPWRESGIAASKGCGSAMRVAPIGYLYQHNEQRLREVAEGSGVITHRHPTAIAASVAGAYLVKLALDNMPTEEFMRRTLAITDGISEEFDSAILRIGHVLGWANEEAALDHIGQGWTGEEAIALALYCVLRYPNDYVACVRRAASTNGDSDSIACIAGGIIGARLGLDAIAIDWRTRCENRDYLINLSERMAQARTT